MLKNTEYVCRIIAYVLYWLLKPFKIIIIMINLSITIGISILISRLFKGGLFVWIHTASLSQINTINPQSYVYIVLICTYDLHLTPPLNLPITGV